MRIASGALIAALLAATALAPGAGAATGSSPTAAGSPATVSVAGEPDRDGDGFGDETEDGCPWNAAVQSECPPVTVKVASARAGGRAIVIRLGVSSEAQIQVFGQVGWQVRQKPGPGARRARKGDRGLIVGLSAGAARTVAPGAIASFRLPFPQPLRRRLGRLTPAQTLRPRIAIRITDLAGRENDRVLVMKLHGRAG
jgi:hypothetical protein